MDVNVLIQAAGKPLSAGQPARIAVEVTGLRPNDTGQIEKAIRKACDAWLRAYPPPPAALDEFAGYDVLEQRTSEAHGFIDNLAERVSAVEDALELRPRLDTVANDVRRLAMHACDTLPPGHDTRLAAARALEALNVPHPTIIPASLDITGEYVPPEAAPRLREAIPERKGDATPGESGQQEATAEPPGAGWVSGPPPSDPPMEHPSSYRRRGGDDKLDG